MSRRAELYRNREISKKLKRYALHVCCLNACKCTEFWLVFYQVLLSSVVTPEARDRCRTTKVLVAFTLYVAAVQSMLDSFLMSW